MTNFPEFQNENMGGCSSFAYAPFWSVFDIPKIKGCKIASDVEFLYNRDYLTGLSILDTLQCQEQLQSTDAGEFYKTKITGYIPFLTDDYFDLFDKMKQLRHILKITDNNNKTRIFGLNGGLKFSFDTDTKKSPSGANGFEFTFVVENPNPAPFLG